MKRIITASAAVLLLVAGAGATEAQQWLDQNGQNRSGARSGPSALADVARQRQQQQQQQQAPPPRPAQPQSQPQAQLPQPPPGRQARPQQGPGDQRGGPAGVRSGRPDGRGPGWNNPRDNRGDRGDRGGRSGWNNGGQRHQAGRYYAPRGYGVQVWSYGQILPGAYWGASYVLRDYWRFGLPRPYAGCQWVRSGDDALMIDRRGRVIEVARNLFW